MEVISSTEFGGERPLFESHNLRLENVVIRAGESAIKECSNIEAIVAGSKETTLSGTCMVSLLTVAFSI